MGHGVPPPHSTSPPLISGAQAALLPEEVPGPHPDNPLIFSGKVLIQSYSFTNGANSLSSGKRMFLSVKIREEMIIIRSKAPSPQPLTPANVLCFNPRGRSPLQAQVRRGFELSFPLLPGSVEFP